MNWIDKLEKKFGRYAIHNLMYYVIILYALGYVINVVAPDFYTGYLSLDPTAIQHDSLHAFPIFQYVFLYLLSVLCGPERFYPNTHALPLFTS